MGKSSILRLSLPVLGCLYIIVAAALSPVYGDVYMRIAYNEVYQGRLISFECLQADTNKPVKVRAWLFNGAPLPSDPLITTARYPNYNYLLISSTLPRHTGLYTCIAEDGGQLRNASQRLVVRCPIVTFDQPVRTAIVGSNVTLKCEGKCYEYVNWLKDDYSVTTTQRERFSSPGNGSILYINNVSMSDNGTFVCEFISMTTAFAYVQLLVNVPADRVTVVKSSRVAEIGHSYALQCQSNGIPLPTSVFWYNNSVLVRSTNRVNTQYARETGTATLTIRRLARYDLSKIECRFKQELQAGQFHYVNAATLITPTGKPDPPTHLTLDLYISESLSFHLSWASPAFSGNLHMLAYRITYWDEDKCRMVPMTTCVMGEYWLDDSTLSHRFELSEYTTHTRLCVCVQSVNNDGLSIPSETKCVGIRHNPPAVLQPATDENPSAELLMPVSKTEFQVVLKNVDDLCSGIMQVSGEVLTRALSSRLSWLCSCVVPNGVLTPISYIQLGGIIYFRGSLRSAHAEGIVGNLSQDIQTGTGRIRLSNRYLIFLPTCPTRVNDGTCLVSEKDSSAVSCQTQLNSQSVEASSQSTVDDDTSSWSLLSIGVAAFLVGLLVLLGLVLILVLCVRYRHRRQMVADRSNCGQAATSKFSAGPFEAELLTGMPYRSQVLTSSSSAVSNADPSSQTQEDGTVDLQ